MPTSVRFLEQEQVVESIYVGAVGGDEMLRSAMKAIELARQKNCPRFLTDLTALLQGPSVTQLLGAVEKYGEWGIPRQMREALVAPPIAQDKRDVQFYEDACQNRGWNSRIFADRASALAWLMAAPIAST